jgi:hypothetical protein
MSISHYSACQRFASDAWGRIFMFDIAFDNGTKFPALKNKDPITMAQFQYKIQQYSVRKLHSSHAI